MGLTEVLALLGWGSRVTAFCCELPMCLFISLPLIVQINTISTTELSHRAHFKSSLRELLKVEIFKTPKV